MVSQIELSVSHDQEIIDEGYGADVHVIIRVRNEGLFGVCIEKKSLEIMVASFINWNVRWKQSEYFLAGCKKNCTEGGRGLFQLCQVAPYITILAIGLEDKLWFLYFLFCEWLDGWDNKIERILLFCYGVGDHFTQALLFLNQLLLQLSFDLKITPFQNLYFISVSFFKVCLLDDFFLNLPSVILSDDLSLFFMSFYLFS